MPSDPDDAGRSSRDPRTADVPNGDVNIQHILLPSSSHFSVNNDNVITGCCGDNSSREETVSSMDDANNIPNGGGRPAERFSLQSHNRQVMLGRATQKTLRMSILIGATFIICEYTCLPLGHKNRE